VGKATDITRRTASATLLAMLRFRPVPAVLRAFSADIASPLRCIFHSSPRVKHHARRSTHCEVVPATRRLIIGASDLNLSVVAIKKGANCPVSNDKHVSLVTSTEHHLGFLHDTSLSISGALPSPNALVWMGKELVGHALEFTGWKEASGRAIILVHCMTHF